MAQTRPNKAVTITNDEIYDLATHMARLADSLRVVISVANQTERDGLAAQFGGTLPLHTVVCRADLGSIIEIWTGSGWRQVSQVYAEFSNTAILNSPVAMNGQLGPFYQAFPASKFTVAPIVTLGTSNARLSASANDITVNGFNLFVRNDSDLDAIAGAIITFTAKQASSTSAAG